MEAQCEKRMWERRRKNRFSWLNFSTEQKGKTACGRGRKTSSFD